MESIARSICARENLLAEHLVRLWGGQVNTTYRVDEDFILRLSSEPSGKNRLIPEAELLRSLHGKLPVPEVISAGIFDGITYQIQRFVQGDLLHHVWTWLTENQKEVICAQIASGMRALHAHTSNHFGLLADPGAHTNTWSEHLLNRFQYSQSFLRALPSSGMPAAFPLQVLDLAEEFFFTKLHLLDALQPVLVHHDLWPGNIMVKNDKVTAFLDFEFATWAPGEYDLVLIEQFCLYPNDFVEADRENFACHDFSDFIPRLSGHYPDLFADSGLRKRMDLYQVDYSLSSYVFWLENQAGTHRGLAVQPLAKVMNFLFEDGARSFITR
jgi:aminoglycoside phosphotransferase (APT) family kinase protein